MTTIYLKATKGQHGLDFFYPTRNYNDQQLVLRICFLANCLSLCLLAPFIEELTSRDSRGLTHLGKKCRHPRLLRPSYGSAYHLLGCLMNKRKVRNLTISYGNYLYNVTAIDCLARSIELSPRCSMRFNDLGMALREEDSVKLAMIKGITSSLTKKDCFLCAIALNPYNPIAYCNLGETLSNHEVVNVPIDGINFAFTKQACFIEAIHVDPQNSFAFRKLGDLLSEKEKVELFLPEGMIWLSKRDCYIRSVAHDPNLYNLLKRLGSIYIY